MADYKTDREQDEAMLDKWDSGELIAQNAKQAARDVSKKPKMKKGMAPVRNNETLVAESEPEKGILELFKEASEKGYQISPGMYKNALSVTMKQDNTAFRDMESVNLDTSANLEMRDAFSQEQYDAHLQTLLDEHAVSSRDDLPAYEASTVKSYDDYHQDVLSSANKHVDMENAHEDWYMNMHDAMESYSQSCLSDAAKSDFERFKSDMNHNMPEYKESMEKLSELKKHPELFEEHLALRESAVTDVTKDGASFNYVAVRENSASKALQSFYDTGHVSNDANEATEDAPEAGTSVGEKKSTLDKLGEQLEDAEPEPTDDIGASFLNGMMVGAGKAHKEIRETKEAKASKFSQAERDNADRSIARLREQMDGGQKTNSREYGDDF